MGFDFDTIVVGAGHAGIEASLVCARKGLSTLLVTTNLDRIGYMSCNPSIGGLAKGHMVREIDVLGGEMGIAADASCIQFKRLNSSKGPAVRGTRMQCDKHEYSDYMRKSLREQLYLSLKQGEVKALHVQGSSCAGVYLQDGSLIRSRVVIVTTGTFMNGVMFAGEEQSSGGRVGDFATTGLSDQLKEFGFDVRRLKTGTPARLKRESINWQKLTPQHGDSTIYPFSLRSGNKDKFQLPQVACYLSKTSEETHEIIRRNLHRSPMYCGMIEGVGPRYCPSIEDKVVRFADRKSHLTFLEPESLRTNLIYLQGISTSLPREVQDEFLRTIEGLENVEIVRYGYAVEYDYFEPTQIFKTFETRPLRNLFFAGQINGTSGYEEAAGQGFLAGVNAAHNIKNQHEFILGRDEAYLGVLVDDLVTKGTLEPYRMFTSRAEHRLVLREDNTIDRLADRSESIGLLDVEIQDRMLEIRSRRDQLKTTLERERLTPTAETQRVLMDLGSSVLLKPISYAELMRRPEISSLDVERFGLEIDRDPQVREAVEIDLKYSGYVQMQREMIERGKLLESERIPENVDYKSIGGLSSEEVEKLNRVRPMNLGQAQRISGVNPSAIQAIVIHIKKLQKDGGMRNEH